MRYEALRGLLVHSPQIETGYAEVVIGNPNKVWLELRRLLAERDRAVELLQDVHSAFVYNNDIGIVELQCEVE